jgi:hypothetical protein
LVRRVHVSAPRGRNAHESVRGRRIVSGDWTLGADTEQSPSADQEVAATPYRNADGPLTAGETVASVTLPYPSDGGDFHVLASSFE